MSATDRVWHCAARSARSVAELSKNHNAPPPASESVIAVYTAKRNKARRLGAIG